MGKTVLKDLVAMTKAFFGTHKFLTKLSKIPTTEIFQLPAFEQVPDVLLRIEIRSVAWQAF